MRLRSTMLVICSALALHAQATKNYDFHLDNGARVLYQTDSKVDLRAAGNTIERQMTDGGNRTWLGFRLRIDRLPGDPIRFRISMAPLDLWGFFGQNAAPREIQNGDRVLLDVLQAPGTGRKVYDTFQVGIGVAMQAMPLASSLPQVPATGAVIHLQSPDFRAGATSLGKSSSSVSGALVALRVPGKRVFSFSSTPREGYRMEAIAEGNVLMFVIGSDRYDIPCSSPIIEGSGAWYLWVGEEALSALQLTAP